MEREIRGHKGRKSQHKATQPGGKIQTLPKPRGHCRTNGTPPAKSSPETEQLIEFEDNLETKNTPPPPLTIDELTTMGTLTPLAGLTTV